MQSLYSRFTLNVLLAWVSIRVCLEEMDVALEKWVNANDKMGALAALTMETDDGTEEEPTLFESVD